MTCQLAGIDPVNPNQKCLGVDQKTGNIGFVPSAGSGQAGGGGAIGVMENMITMTFTPPTHTGDYFNYLAKNFGVAKPAYAQGEGFKGLSPLIKVWKAFRDIVYLVFTVALIIIGLLIMLRIKIDPRTVMSIENQIPKIIIGLILVTFSFAIAGFLIDVMWIVIYLSFNVITSASPEVASTVRDLNPALMQGKNVIEAANGGLKIYDIASGTSGSVSDILVNSIFSGPLGKFVAVTIGTALGFGAVQGLDNIFTGGGAAAGGIVCAATGVGVVVTPLCAIIGSLIGKLVGGIIVGGAFAAGSDQVLGAIIGVLSFLIIAIALLWALFRLWFELIKAYIFVLIAVILGPFFIVAGIFPGVHGFGTWLRFIISNLSVFPTTIIMFLLGKVLMESFSPTTGIASSDIFVPPLVGNPSGGSASPLGSIIGLGIILMTPQVVAMMKDLFKSPDFKYTAAIGQAIGVGPGVVGGSVNAIFSPYGSLATMNRVGDTFSLLRQRKFREAGRAAVGMNLPPQQKNPNPPNP